jgi:hypothetical protein
MRFRFTDHRADYPMRVMCGVLDVSPAGYYAWRSRPESRRSAANRELLDHITRVHRDVRGRYGSPRIHVELQAQGRGVSRGRVERLMPARYPRHHGPTATGAEDRQRSRSSDRPESAQPELQRGGAKPGLAHRHHLCGDRARMVLSGRRHGPVQPPDRRLGDGCVPNCRWRP